MRCARDVRTRTRRREGEGFEPVRPQWLEEKLKVRLLRLTVRPARTSYFTVPPTLAVFFPRDKETALSRGFDQAEAKRRADVGTAPPTFSAGPTGRIH